MSYTNMFEGQEFMLTVTKDKALQQLHSDVLPDITNDKYVLQWESQLVQPQNSHCFQLNICYKTNEIKAGFYTTLQESTKPDFCNLQTDFTCLG